MMRARSLGALTLALSALAALCSPCVAATTGLRVTLAADADDDADLVRVFAPGLRTGDVLLAELRVWEEDAEPFYLTDPKGLDAASPRGVADCEPWKAPILILRDGEFVWLRYAGAACTPRAALEPVELSDDDARSLDEALKSPYAGLSESERRKRAGESTEELEFEPLADPADVAPSVAHEFPDDPLGEGYGFCPDLADDTLLDDGIHATAFGEARTLRYPDEDSDRAVKTADEWLAAYITAYEEAGYTVRERREGERLASMRVWSARLDWLAPTPWNATVEDNVLRRTVEVIFLDSGVWARRYSQVTMEPSESRDLLESCHEALANPDWGRGRREWALREVYEEHGEEAVEALIASANRGRDSEAGTLATRATEVRYNYGDPIENGPESEELHAFLHETVKALCAKYGVPTDQVSAGVCDLSTDEGLVRAREQNLARTLCPAYIRDAVEILEELL